jgi:hypothetical protein
MRCAKKIAKNTSGYTLRRKSECVENVIIVPRGKGNLHKEAREAGTPHLAFSVKEKQS